MGAKCIESQPPAAPRQHTWERGRHFRAPSAACTAQIQECFFYIDDVLGIDTTKEIDIENAKAIHLNTILHVK